jgi:hypothetical protein
MVKQEGMTFTGDWKVDGDTLILSWMGIGAEGVGTVQLMEWRDRDI